MRLLQPRILVDRVPEERKHGLISPAEFEVIPIGHQAKKSCKEIKMGHQSPSFEGLDIASLSDNSEEGTDIGEEWQALAVYAIGYRETRFEVLRKRNLTGQLTPSFESFSPTFYYLPELVVCRLPAN